MNFFITGFTAVGKTTIGKELAAELGLPFTDLDEYIVSQYGISIDQLFEEGRESDFRALEMDAIQRLIQNSQKDQIVALGGGTMCNPFTAEILLRNGICIHLRQETGDILRSLDYLMESRPQYRGLNRIEATEKILRLHGQRLPFYRRSQLETLVNTGFSAKKLANQLKLLTNRPHSL